MSKCQLTTDLIADCMALISLYSITLNKNQTVFHIQKAHYGGEILMFSFIRNLRNNEFFAYNNWGGLQEYQKVWVLSHCLRTIPEFQTETKKYEAYKILAEENKKIQEDFIKNNPNASAWVFDCESPTEILEIVEATIKQAISEVSLSYEPKTIASATLHGQGEFPPSTLEELCQSYKNVMS